MNRRLLIQTTTPAAVIGLALFVACLVILWYVNRLESNLVLIVSENVTSLEAAEDLEILVRQLRDHGFNFLAEPTEAHRQAIQEDNRRFEEVLRTAQRSSTTSKQQACIRKIQEGYQTYRNEMNKVFALAEKRVPPPELAKFFEDHPIRHITTLCHELVSLSKEAMKATVVESENISSQAHLLAILLGLGGPASGLLVGYSIARGLSRSIYRLSVRVQDVAQRLDENVGSMSLALDGDLQHLDQQVQDVVGRVEEVAERLQRQQREMLRAEQLAAVGQLAASVAHEVRNPLTAVKMLVEAALRPTRGMPLTTEDLQVIHGEVTRLEQTVQGFLDFARLPTPQRVECDLREVVTQAVDLVRARARQQTVTIELTTPETPVRGSADPAQLRTVLVNLLLNALDAMPGGGQLDVNLEVLDETVEICFADSGPGIAVEMAARLFTPFASTKATGTGLGLSISRRIVEEHDGSLRGENRPEGGACFTVSLPLAASAEK